VIERREAKPESLTDHNKIMRRIMLGYFFRVLRMILIIFTVSYFVGTLFFLICWQLYLKAYDQSNDDNNFIGKNNFHENMAKDEDIKT
jgi:hypothetical protein